MAIPRAARVVTSEPVINGTRRLVLEMIDGPLGFVGGQYVIIDTSLVLPSGKAVKRAYSIVSADADQLRLELAVMHLPPGPGSGYVHALHEGAEIKFSGPWGKMRPAEDATGATLVLATDTGVTAAIGLVRGARFAGFRGACTLVWLRTGSDYFLPETFVRERLPADLGAVQIGALPPIGHPERNPTCREVLRQIQRRTPLRQAFIAGDGAVNYALIDDLCAAGVPATRDSVESFFNMPKKSAPVAEGQARDGKESQP
jgi:ferredoxin-NADP reductase